MRQYSFFTGTRSQFRFLLQFRGKRLSIGVRGSALRALALEVPHDLPLSPTAAAFYRSGPTFWQRYTAFWLNSLLARVIFFVQSGVKILPHKQSVGGAEKVNIRIGNVTPQFDETSPQHHMLQTGDYLGDGFGLRHVHQSDPRNAEDAQRAAIQLWNDCHIDFTGN